MCTAARIFASIALTGAWCNFASAWYPPYFDDVGNAYVTGNAYPSYHAPFHESPYYCNSANRNCTGNDTYYWNDNSQGGHTYYCNPGDISCLDNSANPSPWYYNDNTYYNSDNTPSSPYENASCAPWDTGCNGGNYQSSGISSYGNGANFCASYTNGRCNDYGYQNQSGELSYRPDLVLQSVYQNAPDRHIVAQICNRGADMERLVRVRTVFNTMDNATATVDKNIRLSRGQCSDSTIYANPSALNIASRGDYFINVSVDTENRVEELDESNNILSQNISIDTDYRRIGSGHWWDYPSQWR